MNRSTLTTLALVAAAAGMLALVVMQQQRARERRAALDMAFAPTDDGGPPPAASDPFASELPPDAPAEPNEAPRREPVYGAMEVPLHYAPGVSPAGAPHPGDFPHRLSPTPPPGVRARPPGAVLYGTMPLPDAPILFAVAPPPRTGAAATFWVDRDGDGDLTNDDPKGIVGVGEHRTAVAFEALLPGDGGPRRHALWLWTSLRAGVADDEAGFGYTSQCHRRGTLAIVANGRERRFAITVADEKNDARFAAREAVIDWDGGGRAEKVDRVRPGDVRVFGDIAVRLDAIGPGADVAHVTLLPAVEAGPDAVDILAALETQPAPGKLAPAIGLLDLDGREIDLRAYAGRVVVVDFWATWCAPCVAAVPALRDLHARFRKEGVEVIGVSLDAKPEDARAFLRKERIPGRHACDGEKWTSPAVQRWRVDAIPWTFVVGRDGRVVASGLQGEALVKAVERALEAGPGR